MKIIKKNIKLLIGIIIGILISGSAVIAETIIEANHIKYSNSKTEKTNVQDAIDELYELSEKIKYNILKYDYIGTGEKPKLFPNKGEGYIVENINCEGANAVWDNINWSISFKSVTSNNIECNVTLNDDIKEVYGETIQTLYKNIYTSNNPDTPITTSNSNDAYYSGNFYAPFLLGSMIVLNGSLISNLPRATLSEFSLIKNGNNTYELKETSNRWVLFKIYGSYGSWSYNISDFKLNFKDNTKLTLQEAINSKYLEPLAIISSSSSEQKYLQNNFYNMLNGKITSGSYSVGIVIVKVTNKSALTGCSLYSDFNFNTEHDGLAVYKAAENFKISTKALK